MTCMQFSYFCLSPAPSLSASSAPPSGQSVFPAESADVKFSHFFESFQTLCCGRFSFSPRSMSSRRDSLSCLVACGHSLGLITSSLSPCCSEPYSGGPLQPRTRLKGSQLRLFSSRANASFDLEVAVHMWKKSRTHLSCNPIICSYSK